MFEFNYNSTKNIKGGNGKIQSTKQRCYVTIIMKKGKTDI